MTAEELVAALFERLSLTDLQPEEPGRWRIVFDGDLAVDLQLLGPKRIRLEAALGPLPDDDYRAEMLLRTTLQRNLAFMGGGVAKNVLILDPDRGILSIHRTEIAEDSDEESFAAAVEDFVNAAEGWLEFLAVEAAPTPPGFAMRM
jgi:Tir chaperone protein (CesT).